MTFSAETLTILGETIVARSATDAMGVAVSIRTLHLSTDGAEALRQIVRNDLGGAAGIIADALWVNL